MIHMLNTIIDDLFDSSISIETEKNKIVVDEDFETSISAGYPDKDAAPSHNPKVIFNEDVLPIGATRWLENNG